MKRILLIAMIAAALGLSATVPAYNAFAGCPAYDPNCGKK